jgi:hypothetical protein
MMIQATKRIMIPMWNQQSIFAQYFVVEKPQWLAIYFSWAPSVPKKHASILTHAGYDVLIPDYLWSYRSDGFFTPESCQKMVEVLWLRAKKWLLWRSYKKTIFVWASFGWLRANCWYYDEFLLLAPILQPGLLGTEEYKEDSIDDFIWDIQEYYYNVYRGFSTEQWRSFLIHYTCVFPTGKKVTILHGEADLSVHYSRSVLVTRTNNKRECKVLKSVGHSAKDLLQWFIESL